MILLIVFLDGREKKVVKIKKKLRTEKKGHWDGSAVKSIGCSSKKPKLGPQYSHVSS